MLTSQRAHFVCELAQRDLIDEVAQRGARKHLVYATVTSAFDMCLFRCRTSSGKLDAESHTRAMVLKVCSHFLFVVRVRPLLSSAASTVHENSYRSHLHHCFGGLCPPVEHSWFSHYYWAAGHGASKP